MATATGVLQAVTVRMMDFFESIHPLVALVCAAGVLMAYMSDEEHAKGYASKMLNGSKGSTLPVKGETEEKLLSPSILSNFVAFLSDVVVSIQKGNILQRLSAYFTSWVELLQLMWEARALQAQTKSKRQFLYMMEKRVLGIHIEKGESEVKSYDDVKQHLGKNWPFMWGVSNVKSSIIECDGYQCIPMSSYSYLDLLRCSEVQDTAIAAARLYSSGNHGPRMLGGNTRILIELEKTIAEFFGREKTLLCATGFLSCMSVACAVASEGDVIFSDSRAHASLRSGMKLCGAKIINFKHNDYVHAEKLMRKHRKKYNGGWLMIESVFSMDGDIPDLPAADALAKAYGLKIILDEAHGLGVLGKTGRGLEEHFEMPGVCTLICGTFSKSIASIGGYITGPRDLVDFMDFHAPGNVFSAPLPAYCAGAALKAFELIDRESWRVAKAQENSGYLRQCLLSGLGEWPKNYPESHKYELEGDRATTVLPVVFQDDIDRTMRVASLLKTRGYMVSAVAFPACPLRRPRLRLTATAAYDRDLIENFVRALVLVCVEQEPSETSIQLKNLIF